ncbi:MAG: winged helix-turn-helix transcriptional regulator [Halioglobus sp.]|nr:winged helix-turn-helix transcriptional regulator [Halioglobus sp.]
MPGKHPHKQELGQTLMLVARDFQKRLDRDLHIRGIPGIGARHRAIFLFLGRNGASRAVDLADAAGIRPQSMMKIVHELESLGLVERCADPTDSRAKLIDFTARGHALIGELSRSTEIVWQQYADILGTDSLQETVDNLNTLLQAGEPIRE